METLNQQLKQFRLDRKLSQRALAAKLGCSHSYIGRLENGRSKIRPCILTGYKLIGFKENKQDNPTTFTSQEYQELKNYQDKQQKSINLLNEKVCHIYTVAYNNSMQNDQLSADISSIIKQYNNDNHVSDDKQVDQSKWHAFEECMLIIGIVIAVNFLLFAFFY